MADHGLLYQSRPSPGRTGSVIRRLRWRYRLKFGFANQTHTAVHAVQEHFGGIDMLVINAGYAYRSTVEEGETGAINQLLETNYYGAVNIINAVLPWMRYAGSGMIINISPLAGQRTAPGSGFYAATAGKRRKEYDTIEGRQAGDPAQAARAIMTLAECEQPPMRLLLGHEALKLAEVDLNQQLDDLMDWESVSLSTDFNQTEV